MKLKGYKVVLSELSIYKPIGCSCFTVSIIKKNKINYTHELLSFEAITQQKPFCGRSLPGPAGDLTVLNNKFLYCRRRRSMPSSRWRL